MATPNSMVIISENDCTFIGSDSYTCQLDLKRLTYTSVEKHQSVSIKFGNFLMYRIYSCISRPFTTNKSAQKIALDLYTSHTQRPDQAVREISITTA